MAASSKTGSHPLRALMAAAVTAIALAMAVPAGVANGQDQGIDRGVIPMAPDAPSRYVVVPGDTLWDISAKFLTDPWYWPEIWHVNPQVANPHLIYPGDELALTWVDGRPQVTLASSGNVRLSPRVRANPLSMASPRDSVRTHRGIHVAPGRVVQGPGQWRALCRACPRRQADFLGWQ